MKRTYLVMAALASSALVWGCAEPVQEGGPDSNVAVDGTIELTTEVGEPVVFGEIGAILSDDEGRIYVADVMVHEIIVVDQHGSQLPSIGRAGDGPGEFGRLSGTLAWMGDLLVAFDQQRRHFAYFSRDGDFVGPGTLEEPDGTLLAGTELFTGGQSAYGRLVIPSAQAPGIEFPMNPDGGVQVISPPVPDIVYARLAPDGTLSPLAAIYDSIPPISSVDCARADQSAIEILPVPFRDWGPYVAATPSGEIVVAGRDRYELRMIDPTTGEVVQEIRHTSAPLPVTNAAWEAHPTVQWLRRVASESGGPLVLATDPSAPCPIDEERPEFVPPIRSVVSDEEGRLWVESTTEQGFDMTVFNTDGSVAGRVPMPERDVRVAPFVRNGTLYLVTRDSLDVQTVHGYEVSLPR